MQSRMNSRSGRPLGALGGRPYFRRRADARTPGSGSSCQITSMVGRACARAIFERFFDLANGCGQCPLVGYRPRSFGEAVHRQPPDHVTVANDRRQASVPALRTPRAVPVGDADPR